MQACREGSGGASRPPSEQPPDRGATAEIVHRSEVAEHVDPTDKPSFLTLPFTITIEQQETPARCLASFSGLTRWKYVGPK